MADSSKPNLWDGSHPSSLALSQYHTQQLPPQEREIVTRHLQSCTQCRQQLAELEQEDGELIGLVQGFTRLGVPSPVERLNISPLDDHIRYSLLDGFVEGTLSQKERQQVEAHCTTCRECDNELKMLFEFDKLAQLSTLTEVETATAAVAQQTEKAVPLGVPPMIVPLPAAVKGTDIPRVNWWKRLFFPLQAAVLASLMFVIFQNINLTTKLKDQTKGSQTSLAQLQTEKNQAKFDQAKLKKQLDDAIKKSGSKNQTVNSLNQRIEDLKGEVTQRDNQIKQLQSQSNSAAEPTDAPPPTQAPQPAPAIQHVGDEFVIRTESGYAVAQGLQELPQRAVQALNEGRLPVTKASESLRVPNSTSKGGTSIQAISPIATRVRQQQPSFRWEAVKGASGYRIIIKDSSGEGDDIYSPALQTTQWNAPSPLPRGRKYTWIVQAFKGTSMIASSQVSMFEVLGTAENRALDLKLQKAKGSALNQSFILLDAGVQQEAEEKFRPFASADKTISKRR